MNTVFRIALVFASPLLLLALTTSPAMAWWAVSCPGEPYLGYAVTAVLCAALLLFPFVVKYSVVDFTDALPQPFGQQFLRVNAYLYPINIAAAFFLSGHIYAVIVRASFVDHAHWIALGIFSLLISAGIEAWAYNRHLHLGAAIFRKVFIAAITGWIISLPIFILLLTYYPGELTYTPKECWFRYKISSH